MAILDRAASLPAATRTEQLSKHMVEPQLSRTLKRIKKLETDGIATYGNIVVHIRDVRIHGDEATVDDCQDSSGAGLVDTNTSKKINRGVEEEHATATL
ncbi:hypothetical protein, partial [Actinomadura sp. SCN-SB]|uniref:hypothetical protein n=1 Tax=Actinomadura sp. SCN-SB TaxID=3373092 RepID=UPI0037530A0B